MGGRMKLSATDAGVNKGAVIEVESAGERNGGELALAAGDAGKGLAGDVVLKAGESLSNSAKAGKVVISAGNEVSEMGVGGGVCILAGKGARSSVQGNNGDITLEAPIEGGGTNGNIYLVSHGTRYKWPSNTPKAGSVLRAKQVTRKLDDNNIVDLEWTSGFLELPRLRTEEIEAVVTPAEGSMAFDRSENVPKIYFRGKWKCLQTEKPPLSTLATPSSLPQEPSPPSSSINKPVLF